MADVAHATLTGSDLHEPKGIAGTASGLVYLTNGSNSGVWTSASTLGSNAGQIADFSTPIAPSGWLEADGSAVSRTVESILFAAVTIQGNGTRSSGSAVISSLASTTNMRPGYFIGGSGITNGTTILSVDGPTQITMSANAVSSGTSNVIVSPWALGDGSSTFNLPNASSSGRYRRSRTATVHMGVAQADQNKDHLHGVGSYTSSVVPSATIKSYPNIINNVSSGGGSNAVADNGSVTVSFSDRALAGNSASEGGTEARPVTLVVMTCIKT